MKSIFMRKAICLLVFPCLLFSILSSCADSADIKPDPSANPDVTYEVSESGMVDIKGYDASAMTWTPPQKLSQHTISGQLYFANPVFLGSCFQNKQSEGGAQWTDDSRSFVFVSFTQNSTQNDGGTIDGPTATFTVNLDDNSVSEQQLSNYEGERVSLSEEEMVQIGVALADIIRAVETYCAGTADQTPPPAQTNGSEPPASTGGGYYEEIFKEHIFYRTRPKRRIENAKSYYWTFPVRTSFFIRRDDPLHCKQG